MTMPPTDPDVIPLPDERFSRTPVPELSWLLNSLCERVPDVAHAIALSSDGLLMATSERIERSQAEQLAAVACAFSSLALGTSKHVGGGAVKQTTVEMENGFLFVTAIGEGSALAVLASTDADMGLVGYEMAMLVSRVGEFLTPALRSELATAFVASAAASPAEARP